MNKHRAGCAATAVRVKFDSKFIFFEPGGVYYRRFALVIGKTRVIFYVCGIHAPILLVVNIPPDKGIICTFKPETLGGGQSQRSVLNARYKRYEHSLAVQLDIICYGRPACVKFNSAVYGIFYYLRNTVFIVVLIALAVRLGKIAVEIITFTRGRCDRNKRVVISRRYRFGIIAAVGIERNIKGVRLPYSVKKNGFAVVFS